MILKVLRRKSASNNSVIGRRIVICCCGLLALAIALSLHSGISVDSLKLLLRVTGRLTLLFFCLSFAASALRHLINSYWTRFLVRYRRYFGIATALTLAVHMLTIFSYFQVAPALFNQEVDIPTIIGGGVVFSLVVLAGLTSTDAAQRRLGIRSWKRLHLAASYAIWVGMLNEYVLQLFVVPIMFPDKTEVRYFPEANWLFLALVIAILLLRVVKHKTEGNPAPSVR